MWAASKASASDDQCEEPASKRARREANLLAAATTLGTEVGVLDISDENQGAALGSGRGAAAEEGVKTPQTCFAQEGTRRCDAQAPELNNAAAHATAGAAQETLEAAREARATFAEERAASLEVALSGAQARATLAEEQRLEAEAARVAAESRAAAAEAAAAVAGELVARHQAECESLRAVVQGIRESGLCPILHDLCRDPVVASDGQTYDRQAIRPWLRRHGTSPLTRTRLQPQLYPNRFAAAVFRQLQEVGLGHSASVASTSSSAAAAGDNSQEATATEPQTLRAAIQRREEGAALSLLQDEQLADLNEVTENGRTVLHSAILQGLPEVALAILARPDFREVNKQTGWGDTALHLAALFGLLPVCQAIVGRSDFVQLRAVDFDGMTALSLSHDEGNPAVAEFLQSAFNGVI